MPSFKPLSFAQIESNFNELAKSELIKHDALADFDNIIKSSPARAAQLTLIDSLFSFLRRADLNEEQKVWIQMGAMLAVKKQIEKSYWLRSPANSLTYANMDKTLGITEANKLDDISRVYAQRAFANFMRQQAYKEAVMKEVVKPEYLQLDLSIQAPVTQNAISSTHKAISALTPASKRHVEVKEPVVDVSHMRASKYNEYKDMLKKRPKQNKNHKFKYYEYTSHYIKTDDNMPIDEKLVNLARLDNHMRKATWVHDDIKTFNKNKYLNKIDYCHDQDYNYNYYWSQPILTAERRLEGVKNRQITDSTNASDHMFGDALSKYNRQEYKNSHLHPQITLFDRSKLNKIKPTVVEVDDTVKLAK